MPSVTGRKASRTGGPGGLQEAVFQIAGLHCHACAAKLESVLSREDGVHRVSVDFTEETAEVHFDPQKLLLENIYHRVERLGYKVAEETREGGPWLDQESRRLWNRFWLCLCLGSVVLLGDRFNLSIYTQVLFATMVHLWGGMPFYRGFWRGLSGRHLSVDACVSFSAWAAYIWSLVVIFVPAGFLPGFASYHGLDVVVALIVLATLGRSLELSMDSESLEAVRRLENLIPRTGRVRRPMVESLGTKEPAQGLEKCCVLLATYEMRPGDIVELRPGEIAPVDGIVQGGNSSIEESVLTGEYKSVPKGLGDRVLAGSLNKEGCLKIQAERVGCDMKLSRIVAGICRHIENKAAQRGPAETWAAVWFALVVFLAFAALGFWFFEPANLPPCTPLLVGLSVFAAGCPVTLALAAPAAHWFGRRAAGIRGIKIRDFRVLDSAGRLDVLLLGPALLGDQRAFDDLKSWGMEPVLLSDVPLPSAERMARRFGISDFFAEVLPEDKVRIIQRFHRLGRRVAFVGAKPEDAPALSHADVGIAGKFDSKLALEAADIVVSRNDIRAVFDAVRLCRRIQRIVRQNLALGFIVQAALLVPATGALYPYFDSLWTAGWIMSVMSVGSLAVVLNSTRLRRF